WVARRRRRARGRGRARVGTVATSDSPRRAVSRRIRWLWPSPQFQIGRCRARRQPQSPAIWTGLCILLHVTRLHVSLLCAMLLAACSPDSATGADGKPAAGGAGATPVGHEVSGPAAANDGTSLGQLVANDLVNLNAIVNKT